MVQRFDDLNNQALSYEKFFGEMELNKKQKKERIELAEMLDDVFLFLFLLVSNYMESGNAINATRVKKLVSEKYLDVVKEYPQYKQDKKRIDNYITDIVDGIVDVTIERRNEEYFLSTDRLVTLAENESNSIFNNFDFIQAKAQGKTKKTWLSMKDTKVRRSHWHVDNETVLIDNAFEVGDSLMLFPRDTSLGATADEIANCRCTVKYS